MVFYNSLNFFQLEDFNIVLSRWSLSKMFIWTSEAPIRWFYIWWYNFFLSQHQQTIKNVAKVASNVVIYYEDLLIFSNNAGLKNINSVTFVVDICLDAS